MEKLCPIDGTRKCPSCPGAKKCLEEQSKFSGTSYDYSLPAGLDSDIREVLNQDGKIGATKLN